MKPRRGGGTDLIVPALRATPAIPEVLAKGDLSLHPNTKPDKKPLVRRYARLAAPIEIGGRVQSLAVVLEEWPTG